MSEESTATISLSEYTGMKRRIEELERERKRDCVAFFQWFWNQPGTNAEQAYDEWATTLEGMGGRNG